ncbi:hypothetical protein FWK35_00006937 [Aphis craccivora]|uniref:Uncharacterized protein n=1 Tax=Aphis craccivora TaxID=307492 RepID=A0A6G0ZEI8_APHCR|nr:hypothetical protein FWK35_00006937 [Aphis craccivora]
MNVLILQCCVFIYFFLCVSVYTRTCRNNVSNLTKGVVSDGKMNLVGVLMR